MKKLLLILCLLASPLISYAAFSPVNWSGDFSAQILQPLQSFWGANVKASYFTATSTTATSTFPQLKYTTIETTGEVGSTAGTMYVTGNGLLGAASYPYSHFYDSIGGFGMGSNTGIGLCAVTNSCSFSGVTGMGNVGIGAYALSGLTTGSSNFGLGFNAVGSNTTGSKNIGIGAQALLNMGTGSDNIGIGSSGTSDSTGVLRSVTSGNQNVAVGSRALGVTTGSNNTAIGHLSGVSVSSSGNTLIGWQANTSSGISSSTAIGASSVVSCSNCVSIGTTNTKVGIGTTSPYAPLSVVGQVVGSYFTATTTATSTSNGGWDISGGCYAISGTCISGGSGGGVTGGTAGMLAAFTSATALTATGTPTAASYVATSSVASQFPYASTTAISASGNGYFAGTVQAGSTAVPISNSGWFQAGLGTDNNQSFRGKLTSGTVVDLMKVNSSNQTSFQSASNGFVFRNSIGNTTRMTLTDTGSLGIGTTTPGRELSVEGSSDLGVNALAGTFTATSTATSTFEGPIEIDYLKTTSITATSSITKFLQVGTTSPVANASTTKTLYIEGAANNYNAPSAGILQINSLGDADSPGTSDFSRNRGLFFGIDTNTVSNAGSGFIQYYGGTGINPARNLALNPNGGGVVINGIFGETSSSFPLSVVGNTGANSLVKIQNISTGGGTLTTPYAGLTFQTYTTVNTYEKGGIIVQDMEGGSCCYLRQKMRFLLNPTASNANVQDTVEGSTIMTLAYKNGYGTASNLTNPVVGIGSTTPYAKLSVHALSNETNDTLFAVASSTASATTTHFVIKATGETGIGTTSPYAKLSVVGPVVASYIHATSTIATSTFSGRLVQGTNIVSSYLYPSFTYATSTAWTGTTTIPLGVAFNGETWRAVKCFTDTGTLNVSINDGSNRMNMFNASTTVGNISLSTNNQFTASEKRYVDIGTPASSPTKVSCTVQKTLDIE